MAVLEEEKIAAVFRAALSGDTPAYRNFLQEITPVIRGLVRSRLPSFDASHLEDVVQESLLAIHSKRHTWQQNRPLLPWIYAIARYKSIDALRAQHKEQATVAFDIDEVEGVTASSSTTEQDIDVESAVSALDGKLGAVVRAIGIEGISVTETGSRLSMSDNAVRVAFHRGLKQLIKLRPALIGTP